MNESSPQSLPTVLTENLLKVVLSVAVVCAALWVFGTYADFLRGPQTLSISEAEVDSPADRSVDGGVWNFPGMSWEIAASHLQSEEQVLADLKNWGNADEAPSVHWTMPWGWQSMIGSQATLISDGTGGSQVYLISKDSLQIALRVRNQICQGVRWGTPGPDGDWIVFESRPTFDVAGGRITGPSGSRLEPLLPLVPGLQLQATRSDGDGSSLVQFLKAESVSPEDLITAWQQSGWQVHQTDDTAIGLWLSCEKAGHIIEAMLTRNGEQESVLTLWRIR